jgi:hypothetical protein
MNRVRVVLPVLIAGVVVLAGCGSSGGSASERPSTTSTSRADGAVQTAPGALRGKRYCEVLLLRPAPEGITAEVYNTFPINDCPEDQWAAMDATAIAQEYSALIAMLNGPRYWLMDVIRQQDRGAEVRKTFGGMEMIQRATVVVGDPIAASKPYSTQSVNRRTVFTFDAGRTVYELTDPEGNRWVMQSWSQQVDPTLGVADLATLGDRLEPPPGWSYAARKLSEPLKVVTTAQAARVMQDELKNSYSMETG